MPNIELTNGEADLLLSILLKTQEDLDMGESMEYGCEITSIISKLEELEYED